MEPTPFHSLQIGVIYLCVCKYLKPFYFTITTKTHRTYCEVVDRYGQFQAGMRQGELRLYSFYQYYERGCEFELQHFKESENERANR